RGAARPQRRPSRQHLQGWRRLFEQPQARLVEARGGEGRLRRRPGPDHRRHPAEVSVTDMPPVATPNPMPVIALLSNPRSTGNLAILPQVRSFVAAHPNIFHYEVESVEEVPEALRTIARMKPVVLAINGGDGTVQAA